MILSHAQKVLAAKLAQARSQDQSGFPIVFENRKTVEIARLFEQKGLIVVNDDEETIEYGTAFDEVLTMNGIIDQSGELTEVGMEFLDQVIHESLLTKVLKLASS